MPRIYTCEFEAVSVSAQVDFFEISPADDKPTEIVGLFLSQSSDVGDSAAENLRYRVIRGHTSSGSGGSATTPRPVDENDAAAGFACETNNTTIANTGSTVNLHSSTFNIAVGEALWLPEGCGWKCTQASTTIVVRLMAAPADALTMSGTLYVREG